MAVHTASMQLCNCKKRNGLAQKTLFYGTRILFKKRKSADLQKSCVPDTTYATNVHFVVNTTRSAVTYMKCASHVTTLSVVSYFKNNVVYLICAFNAYFAVNVPITGVGGGGGGVLWLLPIPGLEPGSGKRGNWPKKSGVHEKNVW